MRTVTDIFGVSAVGGLHLSDARLWLDGRPRGGLAFAPDFNPRAARTGRIVCSEELRRMWGDVQASPLTPPFCERFRLGELHLELLPAGSTPGAAMLAIEGRERDVLIATVARPDPLPLAMPMPPFDVDVLLVDAQLAGVAHASVPEMQFAIDESLAALEGGGRGVVWLFDDPMIALALASLVGNRAPIYANLGLKRWSWRYQDAALPVPRIRRLGSQAAPGSFVFWPASRAPELAERDVDDFSWTLAAELADATRADQVGAEHVLPVTRRATGTELDAIVRETGAVDVVAIGAGAPLLATRLHDDPSVSAKVTVWHLTDRLQLSLL